MKKFCTYIHYKADTKEPFYIGKGLTLVRPQRKWGRSAYWKNIVDKHGYFVEILSEFDTEQEALEHEVFLIWCFTDMGYKLANLTTGGEGVTGWKHTDEAKNKIRVKSNFNKPEFQDKHRYNSLGLFGEQAMAIKYKIVATNLITGHTITYLGKTSLKEAGFTPQHVYACAAGKIRQHKKHTFKKELL
jgi:hypothetical protein